MKKVLSLLAVTVLLASVAHATTPAAPEFDAPVKIGDGKIRGPNNKVAIDGTTVYVAYEDWSSTGRSPFHVGKSSNSGATWGLSAIPDQTSVGAAVITRVAVGIDPVYSGQKIVHTVWVNVAGDMMYSYFATRPEQTGWSTPVRINGSYVPAGELDVVATSNGAIHVLIDNYYTTAASPDSVFSEPVALFSAAGNGSLVKDAQDNLYAAVSDGTNINLTKKAAGGSSWSTPITLPVSSGTISLAVADANTYYVGYLDVFGLNLAVTTNGGTSWTSRTALSLPEGYGTDVAIAVTSSNVLTLVTRTEDESAFRSIKVVRTNDNGVTWSSPVTLQGEGDPAIALDANSKAMIVVRDGQSGQDWANVSTNPNANVLILKEK